MIFHCVITAKKLLREVIELFVNDTKPNISLVMSYQFYFRVELLLIITYFRIN